MLTGVAQAVRVALERDRRIPRPGEIAVSVDEIGTVILRGTVRTPQEKHAADAAAASVQGVFEVWNQLEVSLREPRHRADDELQARALQALMSTPGLAAQRVDIKVSDGWITLQGEVSDPAQREAAFQVVSGLPACTGVTNEIRVTVDRLDYVTEDEVADEGERRLLGQSPVEPQLNQQSPEADGSET